MLRDIIFANMIWKYPFFLSISNRSVHVDCLLFFGFALCEFGIGTCHESDHSARFYPSFKLLLSYLHMSLLARFFLLDEFCTVFVERHLS